MHYSRNFTILFFITFILLVGSNYQVGVNADSDDEKCSDCWKEERGKIPQCQNIPESEIKLFESKTDYDLAKNKDKFPNLVNCLCALSTPEKTNEILEKCKCSKEMSDGMKKQSELVMDQICTNPDIIEHIHVDSSSTTTTSSTTTSSSTTKNESTTPTKADQNSSNTPAPGNSGTAIENSWIFGSTLCLLALLFNL
ncbi:hypothetical protein Glove_31g27 [Diversispora epigaea]|uniref:Extracellular membrane protein CFEM domain-containing protein n=1 Tax=Diversispora epigaea TaxID=1348612 RepID=A0A397JTI7_9GLOM|nr:hypothetical protein Glove_31g27 [Diversispora epigaea]